MRREAANGSIAEVTVRNIRVVYPSFASIGGTFTPPLTLKGLAKMAKEQNEKPIERRPVTSSNIVSVGFCPDRKCIDVEFKSGVYRYHDCDQELFDDLMKAESVGKFVHANLKSKKFTRL